jgi:hypothetical protein
VSVPAKQRAMRKAGKPGRYGLSTQKTKRLLVLMSCYEIITIWMDFRGIFVGLRFVEFGIVLLISVHCVLNRTFKY